MTAWLPIFLLVICNLSFTAGLSLRSTSPSPANKVLKPKVFIISMFADEGSVWHGISQFNLLEHNVTVPGFSPLFPQAHCTADGSICQLVTGEAEINAASTLTALVHSPSFDLTRTYFLIAGVAGISPKHGTLGSVTFARYAVQVALQFEFDAREKPVDFPTGYVPQGSTAPGQFPQTLYGTEVFEVNERLRRFAMRRARKVKLVDDVRSQQYRAHYASQPAFAAGAASPSVVGCDTATSDVFWTGSLLGEAFENTTSLFTNGHATYCTTQQEDNGTLAALLRGALAGLVDFERVIVMRTASDFDRPFPGQSAADNLFMGFPGIDIALRNIPVAGVPVVQRIVDAWEMKFKKGLKAKNYVGDIFGSLGGTPNFGPGNIFENGRASTERPFRRRIVRSQLTG